METELTLFSFKDMVMPTFQKSKITSERQSIIKQFVDEINKERYNTKWKPVTGRLVAIKLGILKSNQELYKFLSICKDYKNRKGSFSKRFFGGFKDLQVSTNIVY